MSLTVEQEEAYTNWFDWDLSGEEILAETDLPGFWVDVQILLHQEFAEVRSRASDSLAHKLAHGYATLVDDQ